MNLKYSVSYFCAISVLTIALIISYNVSYQKGQENYLAQTQMLEGESINSNSNEIISSGFILRQREGYVVVYLYDNKTVFEETDILYSDLEVNLQKEIMEGKYIKTTKELYGFLENYTS